MCFVMVFCPCSSMLKNIIFWMCILLLAIWLCRRDMVHLIWCASTGSCGYLNAIKTGACGECVELGVIKTWLWTYACVIHLTITFSLLFTSAVYLTCERIHIFLKAKFKHDLQRGKIWSFEVCDLQSGSKNIPHQKRNSCPMLQVAMVHF